MRLEDPASPVRARSYGKRPRSPYLDQAERARLHLEVQDGGEFRVPFRFLAVKFAQGLTGDLFPAAKNNEVAPVIAFVALALVLVVATRGRLGYTALEPTPVSGPAYSVP